MFNFVFCVVPLNLICNFVSLSDLLFLCIQGLWSLTRFPPLTIFVFVFRIAESTILIYFLELYAPSRCPQSLSSARPIILVKFLDYFSFSTFFVVSIFFVRPWGEARWSAQTCFFRTWRLFGGSGEVRRFSHSLSRYRRYPYSRERALESSRRNGGSPVAVAGVIR